MNVETKPIEIPEPDATILKTCCFDLQLIIEEAWLSADFRVLCGHRSQHAQHEAFLLGHSKLDWPRSKHNLLPSLAVDLMPVSLGYIFKSDFIKLKDIVLQIAILHNINLVWGGNWKTFKDLYHYELTGNSLISNRK